MSLAHVGLADLFEEIDTDPALLRDDDAMARGRAVLTALRGLVDTGPVVLAIDDAQWLDSASARAVRYALRRFETEPVGVLATTRVGADSGDPLAASTAFAPTSYELLELGPLTLGALRRVLAATVPSISRPLLRRIYAASAGNPLYAIELARGLETDGRPRVSPTASRFPAPSRQPSPTGSRPCRPSSCPFSRSYPLRSDVGRRARGHPDRGPARRAAAGRRAAPVARRRRVAGGPLRSPARRLGRLRARARLPALVCTRAWPSRSATPTRGRAISPSRTPSRTPPLPNSWKPRPSVHARAARPTSLPTSPGMLSG